MSTLRPQELVCEGCGERRQVELAVSINARRGPRFVEALLERRFQRFPCRCGRVAMHEGPFSFLDPDAGLFCWVQPRARRPEHATLEAETLALYERNLAHATPLLGLSTGLTPRLVFGLEALREKVLLFRAAIDDTAVERLKRVLVTHHPTWLADLDGELYVEAIEHDALLLHWSGAQHAAARAPRAALAAPRLEQTVAWVDWRWAPSAEPA